MAKIFSVIIIAALLTGCGTSNSNDVNEDSKKDTGANPAVKGDSTIIMPGDDTARIKDSGARQ